MNGRDVLVGATIGSALMFLLDPNGGGRRRALMRDKAVRATRKTRDGLDATARDLTNRAGGIAAAARGRWSDDQVDDQRLAARVRAKLGRVCSHPHAVDVDAEDGHVTLRGPVLASEVNDIIAVVAAVRGVAGVCNELESHESGEGIPALQGQGRVAGPALDVLQGNWAPATRAMVSAGLLATGVCLAYAASRAAHDGGHEHAVM
jgi:hypothetical protein